MANEEHLKILKQGVEVWNRWREENPDIRPDLRRIKFDKANLSRADLHGTDLNKADLHSADLSEVDLNRAYLNEANLHRAKLGRGDLSDVDLFRANLGEADFRGAGLTGANLIETDIRRGNLRGTYLFGANLTRANLFGVDLREAELQSVLLTHVNLTEADLRRSNLIGAYLSGTNLNRADLSGAKVGWTTFGDVDLSEVEGLDSMHHEGPSTIGIDTIYRSKGHIPETFLRGAGVPDTFITYANSLTGEAIQYYSCFISYSGKDDAFSQRLHADLQQKGVRCWFAPKDIKIGDKIRPRIDESIRIHDKLLLILSENSLNSFWVESEVEKAFEEERKRNQTVLFPVRLDDAVMETNQAWAADIRRTRHIGDFSRWKDHDAYQQAFERLLWDLKAEG